MTSRPFLKRAVLPGCMAKCSPASTVYFAMPSTQKSFSTMPFMSKKSTISFPWFQPTSSRRPVMRPATIRRSSGSSVSGSACGRKTGATSKSLMSLFLREKLRTAFSMMEVKRHVRTSGASSVSGLRMGMAWRSGESAGTSSLSKRSVLVKANESSSVMPRLASVCLILSTKFCFALCLPWTMRPNGVVLAILSKP